MATAKKKKATAKRVTKHVAKAATHPSVKAARDIQHDMQSAWQQHSAKLYQLPFAQGDAAEVTKQAAASMQSATENFMRMGSDALKQWWSAAQSGATNPDFIAAQAKGKVNELFANVPGYSQLAANLPNFSNLQQHFDASQAQEKLAHFGRESAEQFTKSAQGVGRALNEAMDISRENAEAVVEVSTVAVGLSKELGAEVINYLNRNFSQNVELSKQVLACRTLNDLFDLGSRFMKTNLDGFFSESVKLSELMFQASNEVSEPLNDRISESSERLSKALAA